MTADPIHCMDKLLASEKERNIKDQWRKLDKETKFAKIDAFIDAVLVCKQNRVAPEHADTLRAFLYDCIDKKKLNRSKELVYSKKLGAVTSIPALVLSARADAAFECSLRPAVTTVSATALRRRNTTKNKQTQAGDADDEITWPTN
jgi:hypothetical protein